MYDPNIGRWLEEDPVGFAGGDADLYRYVGNDPTNETDPTGEMAFALGRIPKNEILSALGPNSYAVEVGTMKHPDGWKAPLFLILRSTGAAKSAAHLNSDLDNALGSLSNNKIFYYEAKYPNTLQDMQVDPDKLSKDERLTIFKANLLRYGQAAKGSIGYQDFEDQGWKQAGLGAVYVQLELQYGNAALKLLSDAISKGVQITGDQDKFWSANSSYANGVIQIAEKKGAVLRNPTTVAQAAKYLYEELKNNKENIEEWANRNYNNKTSAAYISDHMTDPFTGEAMPLHVGGRGGLARGFDAMLTEAAGQVRGLMWDYALAGLNVQSSAAARAAQTEREISVMSTSAKKAFQTVEKGESSQGALTTGRMALRSAVEGGRVGPRFDPKKLEKILANLEKLGVTVDMSSDAVRYLERQGAGAMYITDEGKRGILLLRPDATRLEVVEELVHHGQAVRANFKHASDSAALQILQLEREIEAQGILLRIAKRLNWTEAEIARITRNRETWMEALKKAKGQ